MHDIKYIREHPDMFDAAMHKRQLAPMAQNILDADQEKRSLQTQIQDFQRERKTIAQTVGKIKSQGGNADTEQEKARQINQTISELEKQLESDPVTHLLERLPNIPADDVPEGPDEASNKELRHWGNIPEFSFAPKAHYDLGETLGVLDFERAAKISGSRFVFLKGDLARLERALAAFMIDMHTQEYGYTEVSPPYLVRDSAMYGVGQLPKFSEDSFATTNDYRLIPTAEVSLTNLVANEILSEEELPLRYTAFTPCFRSEAGAAGKDTRGMVRLHQFSKVELVSITAINQSIDEHERMISIGEQVLQRLGLPYRVMVLSSGDMGFSATKTYDLEVWLPAQNCYREISSISNCSDFQGRRMKSRYRPINQEKQTHFVHTLNGSALAVGRTIVAIMENYQEESGNITIPDILRPYMGNTTYIAPIS